MSEGIIRKSENSQIDFSSEIKESSEIITLRLNEEERKILEEVKKILEQPKDSTVIKQLMTIGYKSITMPEINFILACVFENKRKNKRLGIVEYIA